MTDKEMAEEYANKNVPVDTFGYRSLDDVHYDIKQAFMTGLETGRLRWHDLRKDPDDIPESHTSILNQYGEKVIYDSNNKVWRYDNADEYICETPIAWCEIPTLEV